MFAEQLRRGSIVGGRRVVKMARGFLNRMPYVFVTLDNGKRAEYRVGTRVPGTPPRTDMPAGPVGAGRGARSMGAGRRDGESAGDRHSRLIDNIVYA